MSGAKEMKLREFAAQIPMAQRVPGYAYLSDWNVKGAILAMEGVHPVDREMRLMLFQKGADWACIAEVPMRPDRGHVAYVRFSILGFIGLWNENRGHCAIGSAHCRVELLADVTDPFVFRHASMMPMELSLENRTRRFKKSIIYHTGRVGKLLNQA